MRSSGEYIITKSEVHAYAEDWLGTALRLEYRGYKCTSGTLLQILLIAAARVVSLFAACRTLADAPSDQTIRNALAATLPEIGELERRLNLALVRHVPKALRRNSRMVAIDLTLIPYHGQPARDPEEIFRGEPKSGTTHFHAYATAVVVHKGYRYTLALTRVEYGDSMKEVVQRLFAIVGRREVKVRFLLLDKGFFSVEVIRYMHRAGHGFIIPAAVRRGQPKDPKTPPHGLRALLKKKDGYYRERLTSGPTKNREDQHDHHHLCCQQVLHRGEDGQAASEATPLRPLESASHAQGDPRDLSQAFRHRDQLPPDARSKDQDLHARSSAATAVRGHRPGAAQRVGVDPVSPCQRKVQRRAGVVP